MELEQQAGPLRLAEAPVLRPSQEEWADPLRYLSSVRPLVEPYGMCRIIPPEGWKPPFYINKQTFRFPTRQQAVNELQDRVGLQEQQEFQQELQACLEAEGKSVKKPPVFAGKEIDLLRMYKAVARRGGYAAVTDDKKWKDIVRILQVSFLMYPCVCCPLGAA
jgi:histone demethylase JARID1